MQGVRVLRHILGMVLAAGGIALVAACTAEAPTAGRFRGAPSASANGEACGSGAEVDPHPEAPGIFFCSAMTADFCFNQPMNDLDEDGLSDYCEKQISYAFRPELMYSPAYDDIRGEPYWVARQDSAGHVIVGYLFSYYRDLGSYQYGCTPPAELAKDYGCHNGDSEAIFL